MWWILTLVVCGHPAAPPAPVQPVPVAMPDGTPPVVTPDTPRPVHPRIACGFSPGDWCPAAAGDPCGAHTDKASCQADARCEGVRYQGESMVACQWDDRCFAGNCPTVGCVSRCEGLDEAGCVANKDRCGWEGACKALTSCGKPAL